MRVCQPSGASALVNATTVADGCFNSIKKREGKETAWKERQSVSEKDSNRLKLKRCLQKVPSVCVNVCVVMCKPRDLQVITIL